MIRLSALLVTLSISVPAVAQAQLEHTLHVPIAGRATAYVPAGAPAAVVLFVSGDGGWNLGVVDMARRVAAHAIVIGVSFPALRHAVERQNSCWYPAGDLEVIARNAEKQLGLAEYRPPILVGYSSGATLVYAALAAAPEGTFAGAVSLGFCPDLAVPLRLCAAHDWRPRFDDRKHVSWLPPQASLGADWYVLQGKRDEVCDPAATRAFMSDIARTFDRARKDRTRILAGSAVGKAVRRCSCCAFAAARRGGESIAAVISEDGR